MPCVWLFNVLIVGATGPFAAAPFPIIVLGGRLMTTLRKEARRQLEQFLWALSLPDELIEIRFIENWVSRGKKKSRVVCPARWLRRHEFVSQNAVMTDLARRERANIYFGVCPRPKRGDAHDDCIKRVRCIWCDIDHVTAQEAERRWTDVGVPSPSILVRSGFGIHGYWLLDRDLRTPEERSQLAELLPHFYRSFGGDHVQNLSRVLRPPGTMNFKDARSGRTPVPCTLLACDSKRRFPMEMFLPWIQLAEEETGPTHAGDSPTSMDAVAAQTGLRRRSEVAELVNRLDRPAADRSRRDFAIVCDLLRLGLSKEQIWELVSDRSKFESNGRPYFNVTVCNARKLVRHEQVSTS